MQGAAHYGLLPRFGLLSWRASIDRQKDGRVMRECRVTDLRQIHATAPRARAIGECGTRMIRATLRMEWPFSHLATAFPCALVAPNPRPLRGARAPPRCARPSQADPSWRPTL